MTTPWKSIVMLGLVSVSGLSAANDTKLSIEECHLDGIKQIVQCGKLQVPENYQQKDGKDISINFAVLPAIDRNQNKAPLMFLAGGPGQAAVSLSAGLYRAFNEVRKTRDIILVDQRGTGESNPLECKDDLELDPYTFLTEDYGVENIQACISQLKGDLSQYNSENAIRDFDAVRAALGHEKIAIYGGSYGTRAGLVYMRMFPESLSSVILDSVGPIEVPIGLFGKSAERSFNMLLENCKQDQSCHDTYPELGKKFQQLVAKFSEEPVTVNIAHPTLGMQTEFVISRMKFVSTIFTMLYTMEMRSLIPLMIEQASQGNFAPLAGVTANGGMGAMYVGLTYNIICNEDMPKITQQMLIDDAKNTFNGDISQVALVNACSVWPKYQVDDSFYQPVTANIPTLIISGELDPVTPPSNGDFSDKSLPNSKHIVMKDSSHTPGMGGCAIDIITEFLDKKDPNDLDESCLADIPKASFMNGLNGGE